MLHIICICYILVVYFSSALLDVEEKSLTEEEEEKFTVDWVKTQMDEETWRKISEKERQLLLETVQIKFISANNPLLVLEFKKSLNQKFCLFRIKS